jgi:hypothetical protein
MEIVFSVLFGISFASFFVAANVLTSMISKVHLKPLTFYPGIFAVVLSCVAQNLFAFSFLHGNLLYEKIGNVIDDLSVKNEYISDYQTLQILEIGN